MKVFAINGVGLSGKDTFCSKVDDALRWFSPDINKTAVISTIDPIKKLYTDFFGWDGSKTPGHRANLNALKLMWIQTCNGPHNWLIQQFTDLIDDKYEVVFVMVREYEEMMDCVSIANTLCDYGKTIQLIRDGIPIAPIEQKFLDSHPRDFRYDWTIVNPTTDNPSIPKLTLAAEQFSAIIMGKKPVPQGELIWNPVEEKYITWITEKGE